ncbi:uncharacterized protein RHO25_006104 [Cercospora beticola]|uniref:Laccase-1 n=2 Tax=Cercospora beticola TaxID=122368 RepID=A0ABZ0NPK6_CERBT|nr:hypothetical protein RHO25_006104 [Cercospora beticola]
MKSLFIWSSLSAIGGVSARLREYNLTLEQSWLNIAGFGRAAMTINKQTPGPVLEVEEGDTLRVNVVNTALVEATLHWHGIFQHDSMWQDGVPGVTQWPLEPRSAYTYEMKVTNQTGIYWYHGHFGAVLIDGQRGPIWVKPSASRPRPYSMISSNTEEVKAMMQAEDRAHHVMLADWYHDDIEVQAIQYRETGIEPSCAAAIIFNDKGRVTCLPRDVLDDYSPHSNSQGCLPPLIGGDRINHRECEQTHANMEVFEAKDGQKYMLMNFIHGGSYHMLRISVDEHNMYIVALDGDFVQPVKVQAATLNMAERISVMVKLDQKPGTYAVRASSLSDDQIIQGVGILRYAGVEEDRVGGVMTVPDSKPHIDLRGKMLHDGKTVNEMRDLAPFPPRSPPQKADHTFRFAVNQTAPTSWVIASEPHQGFRQQMPPIMWNNDSMGPTSFKGMKNGSVVDIIFENYAHGMHPFHKHNHKVFVIGQGQGFFKWIDVDEAVKESPESINLVNAPLRDGFMLESEHGAWTVVRYQITFPALSMLHCHKIAHFMGGQQIILAEGVEALEPPPAYVKGLTHASFKPPFRYGPLD